jgi:hypothetical protein
MLSVGGFFERFKGKAAEHIHFLTIVMEAIEKHTRVKLDMKDIRVVNGVLRITTSSLKKNEIFLKKPLIIKEIQEKAPGKYLEDIR